MQWEELTAPDFEQAVVSCSGVGIVPIGVIEPHASHLPLGTDMIESHWTACQAASQERAIVFPAYPFGINHEAAHLPGSVVIRRELAFALLENICDEMGRHGLTKIILLSGHGGNRFYLPLFVQTLTEQDKPYVAYFANLPFWPEGLDGLDTDEHGHACEAETSTTLHIAPQLVRMQQAPPEPFTDQRRNQPVAEAGGYSPVDWYAKYPAMYVGDARPATAEKGKAISDSRAASVVKLIRTVKEDAKTPALLEEYQRARRDPRSPDSWGRPG